MRTIPARAAPESLSSMGSRECSAAYFTRKETPTKRMMTPVFTRRLPPVRKSCIGARKAWSGEGWRWGSCSRRGGVAEGLSDHSGVHSGMAESSGVKRSSNWGDSSALSLSGSASLASAGVGAGVKDMREPRSILSRSDCTSCSSAESLLR